jgi:spermidine/putrescine transport system ATP-binding protein
MSAGRILQIGSPHEIYTIPAERFVADFIGDTNFLIGRTVTGGKTTLRGRLPGGAEISRGLPAGMTPAPGER